MKIFQKLVAKEPQSTLIMVGDGPLKQPLEARSKQLGIDSNVMFLGIRKDIPELLHAMDIFVFPSFYEGLPVTLIEAQTAGLKIFASDEITEEVNFSDNLEFLPLNDGAEKWSEKIIEKKEYLRENIKSQAVVGGYDIASNVAMIQKFYSSVNA